MEVWSHSKGQDAKWLFTGRYWHGTDWRKDDRKSGKWFGMSKKANGSTNEEYKLHGF